MAAFKSWGWAPLLVLTLIGVDQYTKIAIFDKWLQASGEHVFIPDFFSFKAVKNFGIVFGLFQGAGKWLLLSSAVALALLGYWSVKFWRIALFKVAACLILAGAVGNLIDRLSLGYVRDFIDFKFWYTFNAADAFISVGTILFMALIAFYKEPEAETGPPANASPKAENS